LRLQGILILGGSGFVGRRLLKRLYPQHSEIYVIARSAHTLPLLDGVTRYTDSLDNLELLNELLPKCHTVVHLASGSTPGSSALQPTFEAGNNLLPTLRFLESLHKQEPVNLIYVSSGGAVYGNPTSALVREDAPLFPLSYYGAGKVALEKFIGAFCLQAHRSATILRPANFYGPEQLFRSGFGIVPTILHHLQVGKPLQIWGDGENVRDYLYVDDFVELLVQLIDHPTAQTHASIYNVGSEQGTTLNQLCHFIEQITGLTIERQYQLSRAVDVRRIVLDCNRIHQDYHWFPRTDLLTGLTLTWQCFSSANR